MRRGRGGAIVHDRSSAQAPRVIAGAGPGDVEAEAGGFPPAVHVVTFREIAVGDAARDGSLETLELRRVRAA